MKLRRIIAFCLMIMVMMISTNALGDEKLAKGTYLVGKDIEAGDYELTCIELDADKSNEMAVDILTALSGGSELAGAFWGAMGEQTEKTPLSVTIKDQTGKKNSEFTLKTDESKDVSLVDDYIIIIANGSCSLRKRMTAQNVEAVETIEMEWGQTKSEIKKMMNGLSCKEYTENGLETIEYDKQPISKFTATLAYLFQDNSLIGKAYYFEESSKSSYSYLADALTAKYGTPTSKDEDCIKLLSFVTGQAIGKDDLKRYRSSSSLAFESWSKEGNTNIILMYLKSGKVYQTYVFYGLKWDLMQDDDQLNLDNL